jgi:hypothetical protein
MRLLSISSGLALAALLAATSISEAQFRGGFRGGNFRSMGSRSMVAPGGHGMHMQRFGGRFQRFQRFHTMPRDTFSGRRHKGPYASTDTPGHIDPRRPPHRRPPHHRGPPHIGPIGPIIGTGVAIGTIGPAGAGPGGPPQANHSGPPARRGGINIPPGNERRYVDNEVVLEFAGNFSPPRIVQLLARNGLRQVEAQNFALTGSTFVRARIVVRRSVPATLRRFGNVADVRTGQPNYLYLASQSAPGNGAGPAATISGSEPAMPKPTPAMAAAGARPAAGDPAQYALAKLRLNEAHALATGDKILVAVIDSGIDASHPELQGVIAGSYDALGKAEKPHPHGTGIAGAIAAHARLLGAAPSARILAIRAFGSAGASAEATTFAILKGVDYAAARNARVINMSFAGPADPALARHLAAAHAKGVVLVAASGNLGPKSAPQFPAADPNVIAVSATDAGDKMFKAASIGRHVAVTAPGVDILVPAPNNDYQVTSGTSFAAAYVSGVAALVLQRAPALKPDVVRQILEATAKDLGPRGKDKDYGAGLVDAYEAIVSVEAKAAAAPAGARKR